MKNAAFVDSGAFIAFLDRSDRVHDDIVSLFADPPRRWLTSIPVVSETSCPCTAELRASRTLPCQRSPNIIFNMKTIAITIDDETLELLEGVASSSDRYRSRSALVRAAIRAFVAAENRRQEEQREREIIRTNRATLTRQAKALVEAQAEP